MEAATLVPGERVLDHLISVARDAGVRAPQLRHTPNQKSVTDTVRDSAAGNTGASSPQDPDDLPGLGGCDLRAKRRDVSPRAKGQ